MELIRDDKEHPIPDELRPLFARIAKAFTAQDYGLHKHAIEGVTLADEETPRHISDCVEDYGDPLADLDDATWDRSCYACSGDHWVALVDLATKQEPVSDLTLHARVHLDPSLRVVIESVHVP